MKRINIYVSLIQIERIKKLAIKTGLKYSELFRRALDEFLDKEEGK